MDKLLRLITSLNKSEKRYFKINAAKNGSQKDSKYIQLFDRIDKKGADEGVKKKGESTERSYLYDQILTSITGYYTNSTRQLKKQKELNHARLLFSKNLFKDCWEILSRLEKRAEREEDFLMLLDIYEMYRERTITNNSEFNFEELNEKDQSVLASIQNQRSFEKLMYHYYHFNTTEYGVSRNAELLSVLDKLDAENLLDSYENATSFKSRYYFRFIKSLKHYYLNGLSEDLIPLIQKRMQLFSEEPEKKKIFPNLFFLTVNHFLATILFMGREEEFHLVLDEMLEEKFENEHDELLRFTYVSVMYAKSTSHFGRSKNEVYIDYLNKGITKFFNWVTPQHQIAIKWELAYMYFVLGEYKTSKPYVNDLLDSRNVNSYLHIQVMARFLNMMIYISMGDIEFLEDLIRSSKRFVENNERLLDFEKIMLQFFDEVFQAKDEAERNAVFTNMKNTIQKNDKGVFNESSYFFNLTAWIDSVLTKRFVIDLIREIK